MNEFTRTELILGKEAVEKMSSSAVAVFGVGGVGSYAAEALARSGIGCIALFDNDTVNVTNINRQLIAMHSTVGRKKVDVMKDRILDINPGCAVETHDCFYSAANASEYNLAEYDYIIDAIDTVSSKLTLIEEAKKAGVPVISSMGAGNKLDPTRFQVADIFETSVCPLAKVMRKELKARGIESLKVVYSKEEVRTPIAREEPGCGEGCVSPHGTIREHTVRRQVPGSISFVPSVAGLIIAGEVIKELAGVFQVR